MEIRLGQKCAIKESILCEDWLGAIEYGGEEFLSGLFCVEGYTIIAHDDFDPLIETCYGYNENNPHLVVTIRSTEDADKAMEIPLVWVRLF